jgi:prophage maintenance system killer protein
MENLTVDQVEALHSRVIMEVKGDFRVLSEANLHQMIFQANLIPECVARAAFTFYSLCAYPVFREGNTETALRLTQHVLASGEYRITGETAGLKALAEGILAFTTEPEEIEHWLRDNTQKS